MSHELKCKQKKIKTKVPNIAMIDAIHRQHSNMSLRQNSLVVYTNCSTVAKTVTMSLD